MSVGDTMLQHNLVRAAIPGPEQNFSRLTTARCAGVRQGGSHPHVLHRITLPQRSLTDQWEMSRWDSSSTALGHNRGRRARWLCSVDIANDHVVVYISTYRETKVRNPLSRSVINIHSVACVCPMIDRFSRSGLLYLL
jgi:hypothetical protein